MKTTLEIIASQTFCHETALRVKKSLEVEGRLVKQSPDFSSPESYDFSSPESNYCESGVLEVGVLQEADNGVSVSEFMNMGLLNHE